VKSIGMKFIPRYSPPRDMGKENSGICYVYFNFVSIHCSARKIALDPI
jgi:hypothetical protein